MIHKMNLQEVLGASWTPFEVQILELHCRKALKHGEWIQVVTFMDEELDVFEPEICQVKHLKKRLAKKQGNYINPRAILASL